MRDLCCHFGCATGQLQFTADTAQTVAQLAGGGAKMTVQLASGTAKVATQIAQEAALQMAQTYFSKTTLTVSLPESQINKQLRKMTEGHPYLDYITVSCGSDRLTVALDGHYQRLVYSFSLDFDVLECKVCLLYTSPSPRDRTRSRMPSSA